MSRERVADSQPLMSGGLNSISDDVALTNSQLRKTINARLTDYGAITKRGGTQRASTNPVASASILNGYTWRKDGGTQEIMVVSNSTLHTTTYGNFPWTWTAQSGTLSNTLAPTFAQFRDGADDVVYIGDGGLLNKWDGTTLTTDIAGTVGATMLTVHNQRLWSCGCSVAPDSIFYSALNNGDTLANASAGGGQIIVRTFGDETVVGLASVGTSLLIFHRRGISRLTGYGQDDITVEPQGVTADVGTIAAKSIVEVGTVAYFLSERGLYLCNESEVAAVGTVETPDPLLPLIRSLSSAQFAAIRAEFNRATRELWINVPGAGVFAYHTVLKAWSGPWDTGYLTPATTALFDTLDANGLPQMLRGDADGWVSLGDAPAALDNVAADGDGRHAVYDGRAVAPHVLRGRRAGEVAAMGVLDGQAERVGHLQHRVEDGDGVVVVYVADFDRVAVGDRDVDRHGVVGWSLVAELSDPAWRQRLLCGYADY
jgi:hypothetical protein